MYTNFNLVNMI